eukprot:TRINITY_DN6753_c0_g2_i1.p1 TRINITY_DN6753_c0_g2~~TRINITY_DN6753_c0_g2_i1.p1  ORF type:complete len:190 (-),score=43.20 TRINITY_DN6753_c0_g2_i1:124-693(-)
MSKRSAEDSQGSAGTKKPVQQLPTGPISFDDPGEVLHGTWKSEKGSCTIGKDPVTARLSYTEPLAEGERLHGWLDVVAGEQNLWQGRLAILQAGEGPWYGPSFGPAPEIVGDVRVRLKEDKKSMETQIRMAEDPPDDWSPPTPFKLEGVETEPMARPNLENILPMTQTDAGAEDKDKEQGEQKRVKRDS